MLLLAGHVITVDLALVARLAKMGVAPAEPLRDRAAELALELYVVGAVLLAVGDACVRAECVGRALTAHQLLGLVHLSLLLGLDAVLHASEIGCLAFETLIVRAFVHSPLLKVLVVWVPRNVQAGLLI